MVPPVLIYGSDFGGEGRVCAVSSTLEPGYTTLTGYLYDAEGNRVAKGSITILSCNPATNGFQFTEDYVTGPGGEELSMLNGSGTWQRNNVYGGGKLIGTYDLVHNPAYTPNGSQPAQVPWLHLHLEDALGTRRMQASGMLANLAQPEMDFQSLPYGDGFSQLADQYADETYDDSSPLHFTGKERDTESGNDYFGARYYASSMGRWMSPDWSAKYEPVPYAKLDNPQTLNLYAYVQNNPLSRNDPDGHDTAVIENGPTTSLWKMLKNFVTTGKLQGNPVGHTAFAITGKGVFSSGNDTKPGTPLSKYMGDQAKNRDTKITVIKTTPEQEKAAVDGYMKTRATNGENLPITDDCATRTNQALNAEGIPQQTEPVAPGHPEVGPDTNIPGSAGARAEQYNLQTTGSTGTVSIPQGSTTLPSSLGQFDPPQN
ncbi:MAG: RHS repeat-associated core domain-containing protein [Terracidiphilus sp.]